MSMYLRCSDLLKEICTVCLPILDESASQGEKDEDDFEGQYYLITDPILRSERDYQRTWDIIQSETNRLKNFHPKTIEEQERLEDAKVGADGLFKEQRDASLMKETSRIIDSLVSKAGSAEIDGLKRLQDEIASIRGKAAVEKLEETFCSKGGEGQINTAAKAKGSRSSQDYSPCNGNQSR
jgi:hypothetical protein